MHLQTVKLFYLSFIKKKQTFLWLEVIRAIVYPKNKVIYRYVNIFIMILRQQ